MHAFKAMGLTVNSLNSHTQGTLFTLCVTFGVYWAASISECCRVCLVIE